MKAHRVSFVFLFVWKVCQGTSSGNLFQTDSFTLESVPLELWTPNVTEVLDYPASRIECAANCRMKSLTECNAFTYDKVDGCTLAKLAFLLVPEPPAVVPAIVSNLKSTWILSIFNVLMIAGCLCQSRNRNDCQDLLARIKVWYFARDVWLQTGLRTWTEVWNVGVQLDLSK